MEKNGKDRGLAGTMERKWKKNGMDRGRPGRMEKKRRQKSEASPPPTQKKKGHWSPKHTPKHWTRLIREHWQSLTATASHGTRLLDVPVRASGTSQTATSVLWAEAARGGPPDRRQTAWSTGPA